MTDITRPVMRYHGGKFRLAPWVIAHFPPHRCYVEPYGGAAGVLVQKERAYAEVYNDVDGDIVNLFRVLRDPLTSERLAEVVALTPYARDEFEAAYVITDDPVERARRTLIRAEMGFGSAGATKGKTGFRIDTRKKYGTAPDLWTRIPASIAAVCERLVGVMIEHRPALDVIAQHDAPDTLIYCDPPYLHETRYRGAEHGRYYANEMSAADHDQLLDVIQAARGMVVLSGYPSEQYADRLRGWRQVTTTARISAGRGTGVRTECLWINPACCDAHDRLGLFAHAVSPNVVEAAQ